MKDFKKEKIGNASILNKTFYDIKKSCINYNNRRVRFRILDRNLFQTIRRSSSFYKKMSMLKQSDSNPYGSTILNNYGNDWIRNINEPYGGKYLNQTSIEWNQKIGSLALCLASKRIENNKLVNKFPLGHKENNKDFSIRYNTKAKFNSRRKDPKRLLSNIINKTRKSENQEKKQVKYLPKIIEVKPYKIHSPSLNSKNVNQVNLMNYDFNNSFKKLDKNSPRRSFNESIELTIHENAQESKTSSNFFSQSSKLKNINNLNTEIFPDKPANLAKDPSSLSPENSLEFSPTNYNSILFIDNNVQVEIQNRVPDKNERYQSKLAKIVQSNFFI